jgi:MurNAc alpha-1-phosphate uridylyltransferase
MTTTLSPTAMVLAAGFGMRMRPLTLTTPKPLLRVGGRTMLDHALDKLVQAGIRRAVVNTHYLADQIAQHLASRMDIEIIVSRENKILDTGGGIKNVLHHFDGKPFFALNAEPPCLDGDEPSLARMHAAWRPEMMDALLLLIPTKRAPSFQKRGDFNLLSDGRVVRTGIAPPRSHIWISAQILKPQLFESVPENVFSNNQIWNSAEDSGRLYGIEHTGSSYDVATPQDLITANTLLESGQGWL